MSRERSEDPQYKQRFSLLLLSFSSWDRGPRGLDLICFWKKDDFLPFLFLLLLLLFEFWPWRLENYLLVEIRLSILDSIVCIAKRVWGPGNISKILVVIWSCRPARKASILASSFQEDS